MMSYSLRVRCRAEAWSIRVNDGPVFEAAGLGHTECRLPVGSWVVAGANTVDAVLYGSADWRVRIEVLAEVAGEESVVAGFDAAPNSVRGLLPTGDDAVRVTLAADSAMRVRTGFAVDGPWPKWRWTTSAVMEDAVAWRSTALVAVAQARDLIADGRADELAALRHEYQQELAAADGSDPRELAAGEREQFAELARANGFLPRPWADHEVEARLHAGGRLLKLSRRGYQPLLQFESAQENLVASIDCVYRLGSDGRLVWCR